MNNVQISYDLFVAMVEYHLYAKYKTAPTAEEREQARQAYLDKRGVFPDFRW